MVVTLYRYYMLTNSVHTYKSVRQEVKMPQGHTKVPNMVFLPVPDRTKVGDKIAMGYPAETVLFQHTFTHINSTYTIWTCLQHPEYCCCYVYFVTRQRYNYSFSTTFF